VVNTPPFSGLIKENQAGSVGKNQDDNALRNSNALNTAIKLKTGNCVQCGCEFEKRTTWQKYCNELCRIKAFEVRTGKTWRGKKAG
jgi:hypothetical protein